MRNVVALAVIVFLAIWFISFRQPSATEPPKPGKPAIQALRPPVDASPVINFRGKAPPEAITVPLEMDEGLFLQFPLTISSGTGIFTLSRGGTTHGDFLKHDHRGRLIRKYGQKGHGPGELTEPFYFSVIGDDVFVSEGGRPAIHFIDTQLNYKEQRFFAGAGKVVIATEKMLGIWGYRQRLRKSQEGHMLTLVDRESGDPIQSLVPVHKTLFSVPLTGDAVLHDDKIYAVTANTGYIDIIDTQNFQTTRIDPHDGIYLFEPEPWKKWAARNRTAEMPLERAIRAWQASFPIPIDIGIVDGHMIVLYARGEAYFYDRRDLNGALISRNHPVPIPHPRLNGSRLEGILVDEADRQHYAYIDLRERPGFRSHSE